MARQFALDFASFANSSREDLEGLSFNEIVFGEPLRLPGEFFVASNHESIISSGATPSFVQSIAQKVASFRYHPSRSANKKFHVDPMLVNPNTTHVFVRQDARCPSLHPFYKGPYRILRKTEKYFVLDYLTHSDRVSIDRLKPAYLSFTNLNSQLMDPVTNSQSHS